MNSLWTNAKKENNKYEQSLKSRVSADNVYKPSLWYYNLFDFLGDQDISRSSCSNLINEENYSFLTRNYEQT